MRSTCAMTMPPLLCAAMAWARLSSVSASFSMVMLPDGSAVVPRMKRDVDLGGLVEQPLLAVDLDQLDEVFGGHVVDLAAAVARVDEGVQADLGEQARAGRRRCRGTAARSRPAAGCSPGSCCPWPPAATFGMRPKLAAMTRFSRPS